MSDKNISITVNKSLINRFGILAIKQEKPRKELIELALEKYLCENNS
jgi:metal-responsive CopG/Arc/MetJ family transcriptional regulator